jgi:hypothetical protein
MFMKRIGIGFLALIAASCGGGGGTGANVLSSGQSVILVQGQSVSVPAGTTIVSANGNVTELNGHNSTFIVAPGTIVRVSSSASGLADNTVTASADTGVINSSISSGGAGNTTVPNIVTTPVISTPPVDQITALQRVPPNTESAPQAKLGQTVLSVAPFQIATFAGNFALRPGSTADVVVTGNANTIEFAENQTFGNVEIQGSSNTLIFRPGSSVKTFSLGGGLNAVYIPFGSDIKITNVPIPLNSVVVYKL